MREPNKQLREYQLVDLAFYMQQAKCLNLSDPGTGKTPPTCVYLFWVWHELKQRSIWVMPKSLLKKNRDELLEFTPFDPDDILIYDGTPEQRNQLIETSDAKVWLMGFQRFSEEWPLLLELHPDFKCLAVDEIHMGYGGHKSNRTQQFYQAVKRMDRFVALTGTLINGRLDTTYPSIHAIEPLYYGSHETFLRQHAVKDWNGKIVGWQNHQKLSQILGAHSIRRTFKDCYGENEIITHVERVEMSRRQREKYDEFAQRAMLELEDRFLEAANGGVMTMRCRQIMQHPECVKLPVSYDDKGKPIAWQNYDLTGSELTGKDEQLLIHLMDHRNSGEPFLIFGCFIPEIERIGKLCAKHGLNVGVMTGETSQKKRVEIDELFRAGTLDGVVATAAVAGIGFNWGHVNHVIFTSLDYKDSNFLQARRRAERGVRTQALRVTVLEYEDSIDQRIFAICEAKSADAHKVDPTNEKLKLTKAYEGSLQNYSDA